jgi:hypothetical protein
MSECRMEGSYRSVGQVRFGISVRPFSLTEIPKHQAIAYGHSVPFILHSSILHSLYCGEHHPVYQFHLIVR